MKACTTPYIPRIFKPSLIRAPSLNDGASETPGDQDNQHTEAVTESKTIHIENHTPLPSENGDTKPSHQEIIPIPISRAPTPTPARPVAQLSDEELLTRSAQVPLDAAITASISCCITENKVKAAATSILLIGGGSALSGLGAFLTER
jgi:actin-related protein